MEITLRRSLWLWILLVTLFIRHVDCVCGLHKFECSNGRCIPHSWSCDGDDDCGDRSDELPEICHDVANCSQTEFRCSSGHGGCIPKRWQCDSERDCDDGSDEHPSACKAKNCTDEQFSCRSRPGECIPLSWVCDSHADCSDSSDETFCNFTCIADEFSCSNGRCIQKRWLCDGENDCGDGSDEGADCPTSTCPPDTHFSCRDGLCIPLKWKCDLEADCNDAFDETDCPLVANASSTCAGHEFQCLDRIHCVHSSWRCDGDKDCPDGSDEIDCQPLTCRPDQFRCAGDAQCIPGHLQCSGQAECADGSDEVNCTSTAINSCDPTTHFNCGDGFCLSNDKVCDGHNDCGEWEDEPKDRCHVNECATNNGNCTQTCVDTPLGFSCQCWPGFKLTDITTCEDVNECAEEGICSQLCFNIKGSFKCECYEGYTRDPHDHTRCRANEGHASLLFAHRTDIRRLTLDRLDVTSIVSDTRSATALDFHYRTGILFWSDVHDRRIYKAPLDDGIAVKPVAIGMEISAADGLAVDWIYEHVYWTDASRNTIEVSDFEGNMRRVLVKDSLQQPRAIAVNPLDGWMYWTDWGVSPRIERSGMDGSHRQVLIDSHIKWPNGLTLDLLEKRLYWADAKLHLIASCSFEGKNRKVILSASPLLRHPFSLSVFEDWVYWSDWDKQALVRAHKITGKGAKYLTSPSQLVQPMTVHVYHAYRQPEGVNYCSPLNGRCSHLCLPAPQINNQSARISCACPTGLKLAADRLNCLRDSRPTEISSSSPAENEKEYFTNHKQVPVPTDDDGALAGIVIGAVTLVILTASVVGFFLYRQLMHRGGSSVNFDNPVYRKTTEDQLALQRSLTEENCIVPEETLVPLTHPGSQDYV